jgi:4-diphosphocytidyl-2-C-methyl-D-erythritol kinase
MITELAPAKLNLVLQVGRPRPDGLHPVCSMFASIDLCDELKLHAREGAGEDVVDCPGVTGPNLAASALAAFRERVGEDALPPVWLSIRKRIPVAAGLAGGSADAAAALRAANRLAGERLDAWAMRQLAAGLGSDVPSQIDPRHALVQGVGELVEPVDLPEMWAVVVPSEPGLATPDVFAELDRLEGCRDRLDPGPLRALAAGPADALAAGLENDLEPASVSLRPKLSATLAALRASGAPDAAVSGSGPTCFALFGDREGAEAAAATLPGALVVAFRDAGGAV